MMYNAEEREKQLADMQTISNRFYALAVHAHCHAFIEFCGLMNKYIDLCRNAHRAGIDFNECNKHGGQSFPFADHDMDYLFEKLECIYGAPIAHLMRQRFASEVGQ